MKSFSIGLLAFCASSLICFSEPTNAPAKSAKAPVPSDVAQADNAWQLLINRRYEFGREKYQLEAKQNQRTQNHVPLNSGDATQIQQLQYQLNLLAPQILQAQRHDFELREFHHLPSWEPASPNQLTRR